MTDEERAAIQAAAEAENRKESDWARLVILGAIGYRRTRPAPP